MNTKIKLMLILLSMTALTVHGETIDGDSIKLGTKTIPFSEEYGVWTIPEDSKKYVCFSIMRPADLKITISMASSEKAKPLMMLFATWQMHMLCTNYDQGTKNVNNQTITVKNVPAGDYKIYIEAQNFSTLKIEGEEPDISNTAEYLGEYANSFSVSRTCCPGSLLVTETIDEDGHKTYEFKDGFGNVVLKRQEADGEFADTYYIYDAWGHSLAILPPAASREMCMSNKSWMESDDFISSYAYLFAYDNQYRKIGTKLPGCDWAYTIYDNADTPVFTQDGEQRKKGEWNFIISDVWGRPCLEGVCKNVLQVGSSLPNTLAVYSGTSTNYGYTIKGLTLISPTFHKATYYDNYDFLNNESLKMANLAYANSQDADYNTVVKERSKGKETGSMTAVDGQMDKAIRTVSYYDYRGRNIQANSTNHLGGTDKLFMAYDFTDNITKQRQVHAVSGKPAFTTDLAHTYDHAGRLLKTTLSINDGSPVTISNMEYDELGRLVAENRNGNDKLRNDEGQNSARSLNVINPKVLDKADTYSEKGKSIMHELTESYFGATNAYTDKKSYPASNQKGTNYWKVHQKAIPQNEIKFYEYDKNGKMTKNKNEAVGQNIYVTNGKQITTILDWNYEKYGRIE